MKKILLLCTLGMFAFSGCALFKSEKVKHSSVEAILNVVQPAAVKVLSCKTGDAVRKDLGGKLEEFFKVQDPNYAAASGDTPVATFFKSGSAPIVNSLCTTAVAVSLPFLVNMMDGKLPQSWQDDGCNFEDLGGDLKVLAEKLCSKI